MRVIVLSLVLATNLTAAIVPAFADSCVERCYRIHGQTLAGDRCAAAC